MHRWSWLICLGLLSGCGEPKQPLEPLEVAERAEQPKPRPKPEPRRSAEDLIASSKTDVDLSRFHEAMGSPSLAKDTAPDNYKVKFETTKGDFVVTVHRAWAPEGADRFYNLVNIGYYNEGIAFFRAMNNFMVQFGIHGEPEINTRWRKARIPDDKPKESNTRGRVTFATSGKNSRTTQIFINYADKNQFLDGMGFAPFGEITEGMDVVDGLYTGYGDGPPKGRGPHQGKFQSQGNGYLKVEFPELDYINKASVIQ
jgi:peptidyl-prolyl cis-trans isomerase A (cyclophilin A)